MALTFGGNFKDFIDKLNTALGHIFKGGKGSELKDWGKMHFGKYFYLFKKNLKGYKAKGFEEIVKDSEKFLDTSDGNYKGTNIYIAGNSGSDYIAMERAKEMSSQGDLTKNTKVINIAVGELAKQEVDGKPKDGIDFLFDRHESAEVLLRMMLEEHSLMLS
ncbi:MAG: hypothetical protein HRT47_13890 [Candidatus Caenarcaniphilales bacterium]|nr:hypothetical protein [Candidatus Caenarcaniphilales bacterium]